MLSGFPWIREQGIVVWVRGNSSPKLGKTRGPRFWAPCRCEGLGEAEPGHDISHGESLALLVVPLTAASNRDLLEDQNFGDIAEDLD